MPFTGMAEDNTIAPFTAHARAFFNLCAHSPEKARKKCPRQAKALATEANSLPTKKAKKRRGGRH
jgi:hypothetical protein